jgi:phage-related protein
MPEIDVILYRDDDGSIPLDDWLASIPADARVRCIERLALLASLGHELRRPHAEHLRGTDLYELRVKFYRVNYRMLYFFHERTAAVVSHGFAKERKVPPAEIKLAAARMAKFLADPDAHRAPPGEG